MFATLKKIVILGIFATVMLVAFIWICNRWVVGSSTQKMYSDTQKIPSNDVALVLGTNPIVHGNRRNPYFYTRTDAAIQLYESGKAKHFILSGDNSHKSYDEPQYMKEALMKGGVPESAITLDYAGFRTLDSVVRSKAIFQQEKITFISQPFHNYRALFIAQKHGIDAIAFNAREPFPNVKTKPLIREYLARCKAVLDLYVLNKQPKFFGDKIDIQIGN